MPAQNVSESGPPAAPNPDRPVARKQLTVNDPGAYTKPWTAEVQFTLLPDTTLLEFVCENERFGVQRRRFTASQARDSFQSRITGETAVVTDSSFRLHRSLRSPLVLLSR